jgi:hypothetical protein
VIVTGATPIVPLEAVAIGGGGSASDPGSFAATSSVSDTVATDVTGAIGATDLEDFAVRAVSGFGVMLFFDGAIDGRDAAAAVVGAGAARSAAGKGTSGFEAVAPSSVAGVDGGRGNASSAITMNAVAASAIERIGVVRAGAAGRRAD